MDLIEVNKETCNQDGLCAAVCPGDLISLVKGGFPEPVAAADEFCIRCGHCVAVCPTGSLTHKDMPVEQCPPVNKNLALTPEQCEHFFRSRRSIRAYKNKAVSREAVGRLIDIARYAPSGHNSQCVEWTVIGERKEMDKLAGIVIDWMRRVIDEMPELAAAVHMDRTVARWEGGSDVIFRGAPMLVLTHADQQLRPAPAACTIAMAYLELAAPTMGMGGCWAGYFMAAAGGYPPLQQALALPEGHLCFGAMMLGIPKFTYQRLPLRNAPRIRWRMP